MTSIEELNQNQSREEPTDVRRIRDAALLRAAAQHAESADQLEGKPDPDRHPRRNVCEEAEENHRHTSRRMKQNVASQHAGNRAGCTKTRHQHVSLLSGES